jgi:peroxiredoxin
MTAFRTIHQCGFGVRRNFDLAARTILVTALIAIGSAAVVAASDAPLGQISPFNLRDVGGRDATLDDWSGKKAVILVFVGAECPVSNGYSPLVQRIAEKYALQGVTCWAVHCDPTMTAQSAAAHAKEYALKFRVVLDPAQILAGPAGVRVTPEAVVVSPAGKVLYRGRIDDRYSSDGRRRDVPRVNDLEDALEAVLAGGEPKVSQTVSFGCPLPKLKAGSPVN